MIINDVFHYQLTLLTHIHKNVSRKQYVGQSLLLYNSYKMLGPNTHLYYGLGPNTDIYYAKP